MVVQLWSKISKKYLSKCFYILNNIKYKKIFQTLRALLVLTLRKFCQHKRHQRALLTSVFSNTLLLLCGIPERKLIKTRQLITVPDKMEGNMFHRVHRIFKHLLSMWFIPDCKIFFMSKSSLKASRLSAPQLLQTLCVLVFLFWHERKELRSDGGGILTIF